MTESYLFSSSGLIALACYVRADTLFAFNLDGIMEQNIADYSPAAITEPVKTTLQRLMNFAKVMVFSCLSRKDALNILGFEPHLLIGNYSPELPSQGRSRNWHNVKHCLKWREQVYDLLIYVQGVEIEFLGESISLHYRNADNPEKALALINAAIEKLKPVPQKIDGKFVVNLFPGNALTRGAALLTALEFFGSSKAIYFGADEADEDVFRLKLADVFGINVGKADNTAASHYLLSQSDILGLLNSMVGILETH